MNKLTSLYGALTKHIPLLLGGLMTIVLSVHMTPSVANANEKHDQNRSSSMVQNIDIDINSPPDSIRLKFDSMEDFQTYMEGLLEDVNLEKAETENPNFVSLASWTETVSHQNSEQSKTKPSKSYAKDNNNTNANKNLVSSKHDKLSAGLVEDPFLASVLNASGEIEIDNVVYKVTENHVYYVESSQANLLNSISMVGTNSQSANISSKVTKAPIIRTPTVDIRNKQFVGMDESLNSRNIVGNNTPKCTVEYREGGQTYRLKGESWNTSYWFYASAGSKTMHQKKGRSSFLWWSWTSWSNKPTKGLLSVRSDVENNGRGYGLENASNLKVKVAWAFGFGVKINSFVQGQHAHWKSGISQNCTTFIPYKG